MKKSRWVVTGYCMGGEVEGYWEEYEDNSVDWKEVILEAYKKGEIIQANFTGEWHDFIPQNQLDRPNLDYGTEDNWRIKN